MTISRVIAALVALGLTAALGLVFAQEPHRGPRGDGPRPEGGPMGSPENRWGGPGGEFFAEVMMARLSRELELSDEQTVLMVRRFTELRDQTRELRRSRALLMRELEESLRKSAPDPEALKGLMEKITGIDEQVYLERRKLFEAMSQELDEVKRARLYLFLDRFEMDMRRMIGEARERHKGRPGGRPDGPPREEEGPEGRPGPPPPPPPPAGEPFEE